MGRGCRGRGDMRLPLWPLAVCVCVCVCVCVLGRLRVWAKGRERERERKERENYNGHQLLLFRVSFFFPLLLSFVLPRKDIRSGDCRTALRQQAGRFASFQGTRSTQILSFLSFNSPLSLFGRFFPKTQHGRERENRNGQSNAESQHRQRQRGRETRYLLSLEAGHAALPLLVAEDDKRPPILVKGDLSVVHGGGCVCVCGVKRRERERGKGREEGERGESLSGDVCDTASALSKAF